MKNTKEFGQNRRIFELVIVSIATTLGITSLSMSPAIATPGKKYHYSHGTTAKPSHPGKFHRSPWSWQHWDPQIAPIQSTPDGKTYGQWAAEWWRWALKIPANNHPLDSGDCRIGQKGQVWFLGGTFSQSGTPVQRNCQVPKGTKLFFPLVNAAYLAFPLSEPTDEPYLRSFLTGCDAPSNIEVSIDGRPVKNPTQYFVESSVFKAHLPSNDVLAIPDADIPNGKVVGADIGYYVFLKPLHPGKHTIKWKVSKSNCNSAQDITYNITVKARR
ncbi:MAG: hypothetical protein RLZZ511_3770 [Cyanobacteriota bacterium]|jgi:hypothetical protein